MAEVAGPDGACVRAEVPRRLLERRWYNVTATLGIDGDLTLTQTPRAPLGDAGEARTKAPRPPAGAPEVFLAALPSEGDGTGRLHYNGKLERPAIRRPAPSNATLAAWDFSIGIPTQSAIDTGPHAAHARLLNLPTRAMTGSNWTGAVHDWKAAPDQYGAIHFHDDDQGPLGWSESVCLSVPPDWPSGFYAAHISNDAGEDYIPFIVRPRQPQAEVALLVPTFSYQVYGCFVRPGRGAEIAERAAAWGALRETPDMNPQFGLSCYNEHSDGSGVSLVTQFRPMLDTRPRQFALMDPVEGGSARHAGWPTTTSTSSCPPSAWRTTSSPTTTARRGRRRAGAVSGRHRRAASGVPFGAHDAGVRGFLGQGGRLMYLGGNGFYWRAEPSQDQPDTLEVRRAEGGIRIWETMPGESYHAFGGGYGGLWRRIGRSSHRLVGISFSTQGRHLGFPYRFVDGIDDPP